MGVLQSYLGKPDSYRPQPPGQSDKQPQGASQNPEPTSTSPNPHTQTPPPNLGKKLQRPQRPKPQIFPSVPISDAWGETGSPNREHSPRTRTPTPSPDASYPDTQTKEPEKGAPAAGSDRAYGQRSTSAGRGASEVSGDIRQIQSVQPKVDKVKISNDRRKRLSQATVVTFPRDFWPGSNSSDRPAIDESAGAGRTEHPETLYAETTGLPPSNLLSYQDPNSVAENIQTLYTPLKATFHSFTHQHQRRVFKKIDGVLRSYPRLRNVGRSSLKPSASTITLPDLVGLMSAQQTDSMSSIPRRRPRLSLSELRDGLLTEGKPSAMLEALDCTSRLSEHTKGKGIGAFSDVSQAKLGDRLVAVKVLRATHDDGTDELRMRKRLGREIHVWAALYHPHVLELLGFAFEDGKPCLISPWCEYGALPVYLKTFPSPNRRLLVRQIAEGLKYLHSQSPEVVHGDFKTTNVLITEKHCAKICDFGGSKHLGVDKTGFTTSGLVLTTIRFCAPEILEESQGHTLKSDVYSFACVALETMTGKCPFWTTPLDVAVINKVVYKMETPSRDDYQGLQDDRLWKLLRQCWSHEPSGRPTMIAVCKTLAREGYGPSKPFYVAESE